MEKTRVDVYISRLDVHNPVCLKSGRLIGPMWIVLFPQMKYDKIELFLTGAAGSP